MTGHACEGQSFESPSFKKASIGILGGMGPEATILLQQRLLAAMPAKDDADHIPLMVDMNPQVPSRLTWLLEQKGEDPAPVLAAMAKRLENAGAVALAMPCNTAHLFAADIEAATTIPLLNMPKLAAEALKAKLPSGAKVGILASPATDKTHLFKTYLGACGLEAVYPDDQEPILHVIRDIKAHGVQSQDIETLQAQIHTFEADGMDAIIVGCSEFSLLSQSLTSKLMIVDTLDILTAKIVEFWSHAGPGTEHQGL